MNPIRFILEETALLVVDVQEKLLPHVHNSKQVVRQVGRLVDAAQGLELKMMVTEQYRKGLGLTVPILAGRWPEGTPVCEKLKFSAVVEPVEEQLNEWRTRGVLVCGVETHVCILQTCLDLLHKGWHVAVVTDAVGSRRKEDHEAAILRMVQAGVVPTTVEAIIMELVVEAGTPRFKTVLPIIK